jgi:hypothetical protein
VNIICNDRYSPSGNQVYKVESSGSYVTYNNNQAPTASNSLKRNHLQTLHQKILQFLNIQILIPMPTPTLIITQVISLRFVIWTQSRPKCTKSWPSSC